MDLERNASHKQHIRILLWRLRSHVVRRHGHIPDPSLCAHSDQDQGKRAWGSRTYLHETEGNALDWCETFTDSSVLLQTFPEIVLARHGKIAHLTYLFNGFATNMLVGACLVLGGSQVVAALYVYLERTCHPHRQCSEAC